MALSTKDKFCILLLDDRTTKGETLSREIGKKYKIRSLGIDEADDADSLDEYINENQINLRKGFVFYNYPTTIEECEEIDKVISNSNVKLTHIFNLQITANVDESLVGQHYSKLYKKIFHSINIASNDNKNVLKQIYSILDSKNVCCENNL